MTFYIPKGEKGENGLGAYGQRYSRNNQTINIKANQETIIPLEETGAAIFVDYDSSYAIEILRFGVYQINYFINLKSTQDTDYEISVKAGGTKLPGSNIKGTAESNKRTQVNGSTLFSLVEKDEVTLVITSEKDTDLIFDGSTNALLNIIKID